MVIIQNSIQIIPLYQQARQLAQRAADYYWTPGYILLAEVYQSMANYFSHAQFYQCALQMLCVAEQLEQLSLNCNILNNAYPQKTIQQANSVNFKTWFDAKHYIIQNAKGMLIADALTQAKSKATPMANAILQKHQTITPAESTLLPNELPVITFPK